MTQKKSYTVRAKGEGEVAFQEDPERPNQGDWERKYWLKEFRGKKTNGNT